MTCDEKTDLLYPLLADVFYAMTEQTPYGNVTKTWVFDRTIAIASNPAGRRFNRDIDTNNGKVELQNSIIARVRKDITQSPSTEQFYSMSNILIANIRTKSNDYVYNESSGVRSGLSTLFEVSTSNPIVGAFGETEYFKLVLTRSENQAIDL